MLLAMARQIVGGVELDEEGQRIITEYAKSKGMNKNAVVARVMKWFSEQSPPIKSAIAGLVDEGMELAYAEALEATARELRLPPGCPVGRARGHNLDPSDAKEVEANINEIRRKKPPPKSKGKADDLGDGTNG
jgi:hypothetical protein